MRTFFPTQIGVRDVIEFVKSNKHAINYPGCTTMLIDFCRNHKDILHKNACPNNTCHKNACHKNSCLKNKDDASQYKVLKMFLDLGANVDMVDCNGENAIDALILSSPNLNYASFNLLLRASNHGVNRQCHYGGSYLFRANDPTKVRQIIGSGIDVNLQTNNGFTALDHMMGQVKWSEYADDHKEVATYTSCVNVIQHFGGKSGKSKDPRVQRFFF